jgi:preprotein translocase subunit SecB
MAEKEAQFRFVNYRITESVIKLDPDVAPSDELEVNFEQTIGVHETETKMRLLLNTSITDKNNALSIAVKAEGYFEFDKGLDEEMKDAFFNTNAPAILFPYIRAYISTLSTLSGIKPIVLPTLNLSQR